jgi:hypothetical protein
MQLSDLPSRISLPFAANAGASFIRAIPDTTATYGEASFDQGFPQECFIGGEAGGVLPAGKDFNGILNIITAWARWTGAGGAVVFNSAFATAIGGYPKGSILLSTNGVTRWRSTADNNTTDPDGGSPANWVVEGAPVITTNSNGRCITWPGGWSRQTGVASAVGTDSSAAITFPKTFLSAPAISDCGTSIHVTSPNMGTDDNVSLISGSITTSGMSVCNNKINGGAVVDVMWWAEGMVQWP